jgi:FkbM family methyltransferase
MIYDFIEIGTSDFDTLIQNSTNEKGISVDPLKIYLDNLPERENVIKVNCAVGERNETVDVYYIDPKDIDANNLPSWLRGCNSIKNPHPSAEKELKDLGLLHLYKKEECECIDWDTLVKRYEVKKVKYLKIDTEGHDSYIINNILNSKCQILPDEITFENNILTPSFLTESILEKLKKNGYMEVSRGDFDITVKKHMKIDKIIFACNDNHEYLDFWKINSEICSKKLGITPVLFHITDEDSDFYSDEYGIVKKIKALPDVAHSEGITYYHGTGYQAQIFRMYGAKYFPDEVCLTSDIDMLLFNKDYLLQCLQNADSDDLVIMGSDGYDPSRKECIGVYSGQRYPICYVASKGKNFSRILETDCSFEEYCQRLALLNLHWDTDEMYFGRMVDRESHGVKVHKIKRGVSSNFFCNRRIEKHYFSGENYTWGLDLTGQIEIKNFIDCHCARPYSAHKEKIDNLVNQILR